MAAQLNEPYPDSVLRSVIAEDTTFVVDTYLCDTPLQLITLRAALADGDLRLICRAARTLRSSSERVGATGVAQIARKLQTVVGYKASIKDVPPLLARLEAAFCEIVPQLLDVLHRKMTRADATAPIP